MHSRFFFFARCARIFFSEKDGIFSKLKSLFTPGLWYSVLSAILLITGAIFSENGVNISTYLFMGGALLSMLMSIGNNMRTNYSYKRGFGDALAMSMGQLIIVFLLLIPFTRRALFKIIFKNKTTIDKQKENIDTIDGEIIKKDKDEL